MLVDQIDALRHRVNELEERVSEMESDQQHLDQDVADEKAAIDQIEAEVAALKAQPPGQPLDFTGLDGIVARLKGDVPQPTAPLPSPGP